MDWPSPVSPVLVMYDDAVALGDCQAVKENWEVVSAPAADWAGVSVVVSLGVSVVGWVGVSEPSGLSPLPPIDSTWKLVLLGPEDEDEDDDDDALVFGWSFCWELLLISKGSWWHVYDWCWGDD